MKKGTSLIGGILLFVVFLIVFFVFLGGFIGESGRMATDDAGLNGVEAFFFDNLGIVVFIALILGVMAWVSFGGS